MKTLLPALFALMAFTLPAKAIELSPLILGQGEQRLLVIEGLERYSLGNSNVRAVALPSGWTSGTHLKNTLLIRGVEPGYSDLWVWKKDGQTEHRTLRIEKWIEELFPKKLCSALSKLQEVEVFPHGEKVALKGKVYSLAEASRIQALKSLDPGSILDQTVLSESFLAEGEHALRDWIQTSSLSDRLKIERTENTLRISGQPLNPGQAEAWTRQIHHRFPTAELNWAFESDASPTIHFRVFLLELKKDKMKTLGLQWPESVPGAFRVSPSAIHDAISLDLNLNAMARDGSARILSQPEISVRAPGEAELFAGGELPIHSRSRFQSSVQWKSFGLSLKLKVLQASGSRVRLEIMTEVSHLDSSIASDQVPGLRSNRMRTQVDAVFGKPLLLSGLLQEGTREQARGVPGLRSIPILGSLFGSEDYLKERSELVAILLPHTLPPEPSSIDFVEGIPKGSAPAPRNWISPRKKAQLESSPDYPWNAFEESESPSVVRNIR